MLRNCQVIISESVGREVPVLWLSLVSGYSVTCTAHLNIYKYKMRYINAIIISYRFSNKVSNITTFLCSSMLSIARNSFPFDNYSSKRARVDHESPFRSTELHFREQ